MFRTAAIGLACALFLSTSVFAQELRTWTDSTGKFKIKAKYLSSDAGKVRLERDNGMEVEIELKRLSLDDQKFVESQLEADDPFKAVTPEKTPTTGSGAGKVPAGDKLFTPDVSSATPIALAPEQEKWSFEPAKPAAGAAMGKRPITVPPKAGFFEKTRAVVTNAVAGRAVIGYTMKAPGAKEAQTRLVLCNLAGGKSIPGTIPDQLVPLALHDNGTQVLVRSDEFGRGKNNRLELWEFKASGVERGVRWIPYEDLRDGDSDVRWASFFGAEKLVTVSESGKLVIWNLGDLSALASLQIQGGCIPALSPDGKLLAFTTDSEVGILDLEKETVLAMQSITKTPWPTLAFSPSGARLACLGFDRVYVWEMGTGQLYREIALMGSPGNGMIVWPSEDHLLIGNSTLFDLQNQVKLWTYRGHEYVARAGEMCWFVASQGEDQPGALVPAKIPHSGVEAKLKESLADPNFFVLKPGAVVKIDTSGVADAAQRAELDKTLAKRVEAMGMTAAPSGNITLVASTEVGEERDVSYRTFGRGFGVKTYKFKPHVVKLAYMYDGQPAWQSQSSNLPGFIHLKEGETVEDVLRRHEVPNYKWYEAVELPKLLPKPSGSPTLGTSQVSVSGVR